MFTYIYRKNHPNVGKYTIHGCIVYTHTHIFSEPFPQFNHLIANGRDDDLEKKADHAKVFGNFVGCKRDRIGNHKTPCQDGKNIMGI